MKTKKYILAIAIFGGTLFTAQATNIIDLNDQQKQKSEKWRYGESLQTVKQSSKKSIVQGTIIATIIAFSPYLFYLYENVPEAPLWNFSILWWDFSYVSHGWQNANVAFWALTNKVIPLLFLFIWFFTNRHWWYHALLVPIAMYIFQLLGTINDDLRYFDSVDFYYMIPVMAVIVPSIYLIRAKMLDKLVNADKSLEELEEEFMIKPKGFWERLKDYF